MPCLDEEQGVGVCVETALAALAAMGVAGEVVVVDNGSTDRSAEVARAAGARVVEEPRRGYGSAYRRGFEEARGRYLVMGDADRTYPFEDLGRFVEPLMAGRCDLVMGDRLGGDILPGAMPWTHRWIGNPILSGMLRLLFHTRISDSHCGMRAFTREAYDRLALRTTGMEFASEMVVSALREHLRVEEMPITYHPREGESKLSGLRDAWRHVRFMLLYSPSYLFQLPGLLLMVVGAFLVLALAGGPRVLFGHRWDYHPLLFGAIALIVGYQLVLFDTFAKIFAAGAGLARPGTVDPPGGGAVLARAGIDPRRRGLAARPGARGQDRHRLGPRRVRGDVRGPGCGHRDGRHGARAPDGVRLVPGQPDADRAAVKRPFMDRTRAAEPARGILDPESESLHVAESPEPLFEGFVGR